jgi:hypothetical protein
MNAEDNLTISDILTELRRVKQYIISIEQENKYLKNDNMYLKAECDELEENLRKKNLEIEFLKGFIKGQEEIEK